jgi:hypothetical protein
LGVSSRSESQRSVRQELRPLAALEDHVVDRALGKAPAHRQPGMAGTDDYSVVRTPQALSPDARNHLTSTVTLVGLVMMS